MDRFLYECLLKRAKEIQKIHILRNDHISFLKAKEIVFKRWFDR